MGGMHLKQAILVCLAAQVNIGHLNIYGRYAIGLSNLNDLDNQEKWKSQSFQIGLGFTL